MDNLSSGTAIWRINMKNYDVKRVTNVLGLQRHMVGIKFIDFKEDFDKLEIPLADKAGSWCYQVRTAMDGKMFKVGEKLVSCDYGRYALGLSKPDTTITEGRSFNFCGLSESNAIGKSVVNSMNYPNHAVYGVALGPLDEMEDADVVIICDYAEVIMRVMQGYAYKYGNPEHLSFFGNQAMCADLTAKPYGNNDINVSMFCKGTRQYGKFDKGEAGVAFPISMFDNIADGIVSTLNIVLYNQDKKRIEESFDDLDDLGIEIHYGETYGSKLIEYDTSAAEKRKKEKTEK